MCITCHVYTTPQAEGMQINSPPKNKQYAGYIPYPGGTQHATHTLNYTGTSATRYFYIHKQALSC